jgi:hypothetical protein
MKTQLSRLCLFCRQFLVGSVLAFVSAFGVQRAMGRSLAAPNAFIMVTNANDSGDGSLRQAIADANPGDTIEFGGNYEIIVQSELIIEKDLVIDATGYDITVNGNHTTRLFHVIDGVVTINHLVLKNGYLSSETEEGVFAGGLFNEGTLVLNDCIVADNTTWTSITNSVGGGIVNYAALTLNRSQIFNNHANTDDGVAMGGGIANYGVLTLSQSAVYSNTATRMGGGIYNEGTLTISNSQISANVALEESGGGIYSFVAATLTALRTTFAENTASWGGAIANYGDAILTNCTFSGNLATGAAGFGFGGGLYNEYGSAVMINSTLSGNSASNAGGGVFDNNSQITFKNTIITASQSGGNCAIHTDGGSIVNGGNNIDSGDTCGWNQENGSMSNTDPHLGVITDGIFPLTSQSPAINTVTWNAPNECPEIDQRGLPRPIDTLCDIGAVEYQSITAPGMTMTVSGPGLLNFEPMAVVIDVVDTGGCLTGLTVAQRDFNHLFATSGIQTQRYWSITPTGCVNGFNVTLTLPVNFTPDSDDKLCRYTGSGQVWSCVSSGYSENSIIRTDVTAFSDWAVGNNVGPTSVTLTAFQAHSANPSAIIQLGVFILLLASGIGLSDRSKGGKSV